MTKLIERVQAVLDVFDYSNEKINEHDVYDALSRLESEDLEKDKDSEFVYCAESMAFSFCEDYSSDSGWGTYYGPMFVLKNEDGQWVEGPSIKLVTQEMLAYWAERSNVAQNPLLSFRYADLAWDFSEKITGKPANYTIAQKVIDATIDFVNKKTYKHEIEAIKKIKRGLHLALSMNDTVRINATKNAMLKLEDEIAQDNLAGLWGFCFDELLDNKKVLLSDTEKQKIIDDMEARLARIVSNETLDAHSAEVTAIRLAQYYRKWNRPEDYQRVLRTYGQLVIEMIEKIGSMSGGMWVEQLYGIYYEYGMVEEANKLTSLIRELGQKTAKEMKVISHEFSISVEEMEKFVDGLTDGDLQKVLERIAVYYVPDPEEIKKQVLDLSKGTPLHSLIPITITDWEGRPIAKVGSIEDDLEGRVVNQTSQYMSVSSVFLRATIDKIKSKFNPTCEELINHIAKSPLFVEDNREIVSIGIESYLAGEHIIAAHILIPQIENAIRQLLKLLGGVIYKPGRNGSIFLRNLDELLRDEKVVATLGDRATSYLRVLLTDQRGWNLRNDVCHSTIQPDRFSWTMTDRIFHSILLVALIREKHDDVQE